MLDLKLFLDDKVGVYNRSDFIVHDPISIPHLFSKKQDIEIAGFFAAILAWGNRKSILKSCKRLLSLMDNAPYEFILNHQEKDLKGFLHFAHRTFNTTDVLYFILFFQNFYLQNESLEMAFSQFLLPTDENVEKALIGFNQLFFSLPEAPIRTQKHIATPAKKSACKRLNMYLRWMVRHDKFGVDFGIWKKIKPSQLVCPLDVHSSRVARQLGLLERKQNDWAAALELTSKLKTFDKNDPVKYDFALFGMGVTDIV